MHWIFILFKRREWSRWSNLRRDWPFTLHRKLELCCCHPSAVRMESESWRVSSHGNRLFLSTYVLLLSIVRHFDPIHSHPQFQWIAKNYKINWTLIPFSQIKISNITCQWFGFHKFINSYLHNQLTLTNHAIHINPQFTSLNNNDS